MTQLLTFIAIFSCADLVLGAFLVLPTSANCGDKAVLTCTSSDCQFAQRFTRNGTLIYNTGPVSGIDPGKYDVNVPSDSQAQLTINNIQLSDNTTYACSCGFNNVSVSRPLRYECKATNSTATIGKDKKLNITVDSLYPKPSSVVANLTSPSTRSPGIQTCGPSFLLVAHYRCTWVSTSSLRDGSYGYTITIITETEAVPVTGKFRIVTPKTPTISKLTAVSYKTEVLHGIQDNPLAVQCVSSGGIPAPALAFYRGSTPIYPPEQSTSLLQQDGTYTVTLTHTFTPSREDDNTTFLCQVFYPGSTNESSPNPSPATALLYLDLKPDIPEVSQIGVTVSGGSMTLRCTSTNGRPAPSITWSYQGHDFTTTNPPSYDPSSETYSVVSELRRNVRAVDNGRVATCQVLHTTLLSPLIGTVKVDVKFGPSIGSTAISGNPPTHATEANKIGLNCTCGSSNPASDITWYNGTAVIPNTEESTIWPGDNNGVITSNILTITPSRYMDGDRITCRSNNSHGSDSKYVNLDILYTPLIQPLLNITSTEGEPGVLLTCLASSKPPATFTWKKGDKSLANGTGKVTDNSFSYVIPRVDRADAGSYQCEAGNSVGSSDLKNMYLIVKYPPAVTVSTTFNLSYTVKCTVEGYPDSYMYQDWVQIWPGYGPVATIRFTDTTLTLTGTTYEMSGVYVCGASNGVAVYGTDLKIMKGNATVLIKAPPVLTYPSPDKTRVPVAGRIGQDATTEIKYWSNVKGSDVNCYTHIGDSRSISSSCSFTETDIEVKLPVHNHMVNETGTLATIKIRISRQEDMTAYDVVVSNRIGESVLGITIVPQGPPQAPTLIEGNFSITPRQVTLSVIPGFHGGYNQTLVVQISTNLITWINKTSVYIGEDIQTTDVILTRLRENTLYHVRVFAYNTEGRSNNFSTVMNFTTDTDTTDQSVPSFSAAVIGGGVGTTCALLVVAVVLVVVWRNSKGGWMFSRKADRRSPAQDPDKTDSVVECAMYVSAGNVQPVTSKGDVYSTPQKRERSDPPTNVYAVVSKTKKGLCNTSVLNRHGFESVSGQRPSSGKCGGNKRMKSEKPTQGLAEIHQVAETTFDTTKTPTSNQPPRWMQNVNEDGLIYADLEFDSSAKTDVVHGLDDATVYVEIDVTKTAKPLPHSDEESIGKK